MPAEPIEIDDVEEALKKADEYAELTGRSKADVVADLLDDGQLNYSAGQDKVEEKDLLDIAQEKAEKLKTLLITIAPMLAILSGVGLEGLGVLDLTDWGEDSMWEDDNPPPIDTIWGCTNWEANNYDPYANSDDGSCVFDPPPIRGCTDPSADNYDSAANEEDGSCVYPPNRNLDIQNAQLSLIGENELKVEFNLMVEGDFCCDDIEIAWEIEYNGYYDDGLRRVTYHSYDEQGYIELNQYWPDMQSGNYHARVDVEWQGNMWDEETTNGVTIEDPTVWGCTDSEATNYDPNANEDDGSCEYPVEPNVDAISLSISSSAQTITATFDLVVEGEWDDDIEFTWRLFLEGEEQEDLEFKEWIDPNEDAGWHSHTWEELDAGEYTAKIIIRDDDGEILDEETFTPDITIEQVDCTAGFYTYQLWWSDSNNHSLTAYSDPDELTCGEQITVDIYFEIVWDNGTIFHSETQQINTTGENWDEIYFYGPNMTNGSYSVSLELYIVVDGEREADASEVRTWTNIQVGDEEEEEDV